MEGRGADPFQVFGRALRIVSLIATKGRLCIEPTSSTRGPPLAFPAREFRRLNPPRARGSNGRGGLLPPLPLPPPPPPPPPASSPPPLFLLLLPFFSLLLFSVPAFASSVLQALNSPAEQPRRTAEKGRASFSPKLSLRALFVALDA